jgi:hypothetical protein
MLGKLRVLWREGLGRDATLTHTSLDPLNGPTGLKNIQLPHMTGFPFKHFDRQILMGSEKTRWPVNEFNQTRCGRTMCVRWPYISDNVCAHWEGCASSTICHHRLIEGGGDRVSGSWSTRTVLGRISFYYTPRVVCVCVFLRFCLESFLKGWVVFMCQLINNKVHFLEFSKCNEMLYRWRVFWRDQETLSRALRAWSFVLGGSSLRPRADLTFHVLLFPERNKKKNSLSFADGNTNQERRAHEQRIFSFFNNFSTHRRKLSSAIGWHGHVTWNAISASIGRGLPFQHPIPWSPGK